MNRAQSNTELVNYAQVIQVVLVSVCEGLGTEESPKRTVLYYYDLDGKLLARVDEFDSPHPKKEEVGG